MPKNYVAEATKKYPTQDFVISHNGGEIECEQVHGHVELDVTGGTIGYKVFASIKGKPFSIVRKGDGGYTYWDYVGDFMREDDITITAIVHD